MATKKTNTEILTSIATASDEEAAELGITPELRSVAAQAANGSDIAVMSATNAGSVTYNGMIGVLVKLASTPFRYAKYTDVYHRHHRNFVQGKPERNWIDIAKKGTGNKAQLEGQNPNPANSTGVRELTTTLTAQTPDVYSQAVSTLYSFESRIPISRSDYRNAFTNGETGIADFISAMRKSLDNKITADKNLQYDTVLTGYASNAIEAGTGSHATTTTASQNMSKATKVSLTLPSIYEYLAAGANPNDADLLTLYTTIKKMYYGMTGRPTTRYNALGVANNTPKDSMILYINADIYSELTTRINSYTPNEERLVAEGLEIQPLSAPWLDGPTLPIAAIGSVDFLLDYPVNDETSIVTTDRGEIVTRYWDGYFSAAGFEQFTFINAVGSTT